MTDVMKFDDWLLAEATCLKEEREGRRTDDGNAVEAARGCDEKLAGRIAIRAGALPGAGEVRADIQRFRRMLVRLGLALIVVALIAGVVAARASIAQRQVDFLLAAVTLLLVPTLMLVLWLVVLAWSARRSSSGSLAGGVVVASARWIGPRLMHSDHASEVVLAWLHLLRTAFGRWLFGVLTHAFWAAYCIGAVTLLVIFFSIAQYELAWGTTLLQDQSVVSLVGALAWLPAQFGLMPPPTPDWILAGREGMLQPEYRALWARYLLVVIVVYGLLPRVVLGLVSLGLAARASRRLELDLGRPGYLRLAGALSPGPEPSPPGPPLVKAPPKKRSRHPHASGSPVLIAVEHAVEPWPPLLPGIESRALGRADDRAGRKRVLAALEGLPKPPPALLVACSMLRTPDAGIERFINRAADAARAVPVLLVDDSERLKQRGGDVGLRLADWEQLAGRVGGEMLMLDLERPDAAALARLTRIVEESG